MGVVLNIIVISLKVKTTLELTIRFNRIGFMCECVVGQCRLWKMIQGYLK